jgi:hypothetical protein
LKYIDGSKDEGEWRGGFYIGERDMETRWD